MQKMIEDSELEACVAQRMSDKEIAEKFSVKQRYVRQRRYKMGLKTLADGRRLRPLRKQVDEGRLRVLLESGVTYSECAAVFNVRPETIARRAKALGISSKAAEQQVAG